MHDIGTDRYVQELSKSAHGNMFLTIVLLDYLDVDGIAITPHLGEQLTEFSLFLRSDFTYVSAQLSRFDRHLGHWNRQSITHSHIWGGFLSHYTRCYRVIHDVAQYFGNNFASFHPISVFSEVIEPHHQGGSIGTGIVEIGSREPILAFWVHRKFRPSRGYRVIS